MTDNNVGTATFSVRIVYNEAMNTNLNPAVTLSPDVSSTLTYDAAQSWWTSDRTFVARYDVADANVAVADIGIGVASAHDASGNVQAAYNGTSAFGIDTLNPPPGALPRAGLADAVLSSGALNLSVGTVSTPATQQSVVNPVDHALLYSGTWLDV